MSRIGIDVRKLHDFGIGTYIRNLVERFSEIGGEHEFVLMHKPDENLQDLPAGMEKMPLAAGLYSPVEPFSLGRNARRAKLDLLHCPHYVTPFRAGCPVAVTIHDIIHLRFPEYLPGKAASAYARFFLRRAARKAQVIFAVSETTRRDILEYLPVCEERVKVTCNAVDPRFNNPVSEAEKEDIRVKYGLWSKYILFVGNLKPHKNLPTALEAFARFRERAGEDWQFVVAGVDAQHATKTASGKKIDELNLQEVVNFLGYVPDIILPTVYSAASVFLFPSIYEGFGLPPLEAMAAGVPVVSSNSPALPEVLGDAAILVDANDAVAFAEAMERIVSDDELSSALTEKGLRRAKKYSWDETARLTLAGYREVLERA